MTPRRVLLTADAVGGVWTFALELARGLADQGVETLLAVLGPAPDAAQRRAAFAVPGLRLALTGLPLEWQDRAGPFDAGARRRLLALERAFRPDIVHASGFREAAAGFAAPVLLTAHSCVRTWWRACRGGDPPPEWDSYAAGVRQGLAAADALAAPTAAFLAAFAGLWDPLPPARVVPNGLDLPPPPPGPRRPVVLAAGRLWDEAKGIASLAAVAPRLPWPVEVAGEAAASQADEGLHHLGRLAPADLHARMAEAAIFAAPARYEPFGLGILEAATQGCALVLGEVPSLVELWKGAARFVPPGEPEALLAALQELIVDTSARGRLADAARERAALYTRARMTEGYLGLYGDLLAARRVVRRRAA